MRFEDKHIYSRYKLILESTDGKKLTGDELHNFKVLLLECRRELSQKEPFLYRILDNLQIVPTYDIPTMAVDNKNNIYINPDFAFDLEQRDKSMVTGVLAHETLHHGNRTFTRQQWRDAQLWNISTDFIMNRDLIEMGFILPEEGCIPIRTGNDRFIVRTQKPSFTDEVDIDITNATCEHLYNDLAKLIPRNNQDNKQGNTQGDKQEDKEGSSGNKPIKIIGQHGEVSGTLDKHLEPGDKTPKAASDDATLQPNSGDEESLADDLQKAIEQAHIETETLDDFNKDQPLKSSKPGGNSRGRQLERTQALGRGTINWRAVLRKALKTSTEKTTSTWSRLNTRALGGGRMVPGKKADLEKPEIVVALDASGSISNFTLIKFVEEVLQITNVFDDYNITILVYSDSIVDVLTLTPLTKQKVKARIFGGVAWSSGGNNESCIKQWLDAKRIKKLDLFILFTDGGVDSQAVLPHADHTYFMVMQGNYTETLQKLNPNATIVSVDLPNKR